MAHYLLEKKVGRESRKVGYNMKATVEIIKVEAKKTQSMDKEYRVVFVTDNPVVLQLAQFINERTVDITIDEKQ